MASLALEAKSRPPRAPTTVVWREQAIAEITQMELAVDWLASDVHAPRANTATSTRVK